MACAVKKEAGPTGATPPRDTPHPSHHPTLGHCKGDKIREKGNRRRKAGKGRTKMGDKR